MALQITNIQETSNKAKQHTVRPYFSGGSYIVTSAKSDNQYRTRISPAASCTCDWAKYQPAGAPVACSHVQATLAYVEKRDGYNVKFYAQGEDVSHHHRRTIEIGNGVKATARKTAVTTKSEMSDEYLNDLLFG